LPLAAATIMGGGHSPVEAPPGSRIASLAEFAFGQLKLSKADILSAEFTSVVKASTQVVAGTNYRLQLKLKPQGTIDLTIFEQPWTSTLSITEAKMHPSDFAFSQINLLGDSDFVLNAREFEAFETKLKSTQCTGGQTWNECGSACSATCSNPHPICTMQCVPQCQCPREKPIFKAGACISRSECETVEAP